MSFVLSIINKVVSIWYLSPEADINLIKENLVDFREWDGINMINTIDAGKTHFNYKLNCGISDATKQ